MPPWPRRLLPLALLLAASAAPAADPLPRRASPAQLDALFAQGAAAPVPAGAYRGRVLYVDDALLPRAKARMQGLVWRGKRFTGGDAFVNRFPGFEALPAAGRMEPSWTDGAPAYVLDYPAGTPLFGSNRDELREVAPGVWLGRVWNRTTPGRRGSWFVLTADGR